MLATTSLLGTYLAALRPQPTYAATLPAGTCTVTTSGDNVLSPPSGSLRDCFNQVNGAPGDDTIVFAIGGSPTVSLDDSLGILDDTLTIIGEPGLTITADDTGYRMLQSGAAFADTLTITDVTVSGFGIPANQFGGAIYVRGSGNVVLTDDTFTDNYAGRGGALRTRLDGSVVVTDSVFERNSVSRYSNINGYGGAIEAVPQSYLPLGSLTITDSTFDDNAAQTQGGAVAGRVLTTISGSTFVNNEARFYGGAVSVGAASITGSTFSGNETTGGTNGFTFQPGGGGAVNVGSGESDINQSSFTHNRAYGEGGAIRSVAYAELTMVNSFTGFNYSTTGVGGIFVSGLYPFEMLFSTSYDDSSGDPAGPSSVSVDLYFQPVGSVIGSSTDDSVMNVPGTVDDSYSVTTGPSAAFTGPGSRNVAGGTLQFAALDDTQLPGRGGRSPASTSVLVTGAPVSALGTGVTVDQLGNARPGSGSIWTIGARQVDASPQPPPPPPAFPPSAPRNVVGVPGDGEVTVSWDPPEDPGSFPVTNYRVVAEPGGASCLVEAPETSCVISGLTNGQSYTFTVEALNGAGWGPSAASSPVTPERPITVPGPVRDIRVVKVTAGGTVVLRWRVPSFDGGSPVIAYRVGQRRVAEAKYTRVLPNATTTRVRITGLTPGRAYWVRIKAGNIVGFGPGTRYAERIRIPLG